MVTKTYHAVIKIRDKKHLVLKSVPFKIREKHRWWRRMDSEISSKP